jgi:hypothetical protein
VRLIFRGNVPADSKSFAFSDLFLKKNTAMLENKVTSVEKMFMPQCRVCGASNVKRCRTCLEHFCKKDPCVHLTETPVLGETVQKQYERLSLHVRRRLLQFEEVHISLYLIEKMLNLRKPTSSALSV